MGGGRCTKVGEMGRRVAESWKRRQEAVNRAVADSKVGRYFELDARGTTFTTELRAGSATFLTMAYIISVNAAILIESGGPCTVHDCTPTHPPQPPTADCKLQPNPGFDACLATVRRDLVVGTVVTSMIGCFVMGSMANLPFALAPGMGTNAYFTYNMVGFRGTGPVPYRTALAAVMLEGIIFLALSVLGLRAKLAHLIPNHIRLSSAAGMGLFLAFTGLQSSMGLGAVSASPSTLVTLTPGLFEIPTFWVGVLGFVVTSICLSRKVKGSMIYGIVIVTALSWIRDTPFTFFPDTPAGNASHRYFKRVVDFHTIKRTGGQISFAGFRSSAVWYSVMTLLYVDVLDTTGSMMSMAEYAGFLDREKGGFVGEYKAFIADASTSIVGSTMGMTTVTTYLESSAGIKEGGRTGLTAVTVGLLFFLSLFFTPLMASVPAAAVGPALVVVGAMMMGLVKEVEWSNMKKALPAFLTLALIPLTYSIANGIIAGLALHIVLHLYDYVMAAVRWGGKMKGIVVEGRNQVSAAGAYVPETAMV